MVTKQQQLEWLANNLEKWRSGYDFAVVDKTGDGVFYVRWPSACSSGITKREWQQERRTRFSQNWSAQMVTKQQQLEWLAEEFDIWPNIKSCAIKMSVKSIGCEALLDGECHTITRQEWQQERDKMSGKPEADNSWHERGEFPPVGCECEFCNSDDEWADWLHSVFVGFDSTGNGVVSVFGDDKGVLWISNNSTDFRPLRTEREEAIDEIAALVRDGLVSPEMAKEFAIKMYDAGLNVVKR